MRHVLDEVNWTLTLASLRVKWKKRNTQWVNEWVTEQCSVRWYQPPATRWPHLLSTDTKFFLYKDVLPVKGKNASFLQCLSVVLMALNLKGVFILFKAKQSLTTKQWSRLTKCNPLPKFGPIYIILHLKIEFRRKWAPHPFSLINGTKLMIN